MKERAKETAEDTTTPETTAFLLSRIYASGWNSGKKCHFAFMSDIAAMSDEANPHSTAKERARWKSGFVDACLRTIVNSEKSTLGTAK